MEKLKMHSPNLVAKNIEQLAALFPNCVTESRGKDGDLKRAIDFDLLKQELSAHIVDGPQERYQLNWPGKREALLTANAPIAKTLRPCREESVNFDTTQNLFIEGDNLDALKLLQETYLGKVKLIYIDPPYNTGNDFIYNDDFAENIDLYVERSNQKDLHGNKLVTNTDTNGRYHSDWLSMMYARLKVAKNLLSEDGVIFISIDDSECHNLKKICDDIFGGFNFIASIIWQKRYVSNVTAKWLSDMHDYILVYAKNKENVTFNDWERSEEQKDAYQNKDDDPRGVWRAQDLSASKPYSAGLFEITGPTGNVFLPPPNRYWRCNKEQFDKWNDDNRIWWGVNKDARPMLKSFLSESVRGIKPHTWWDYKFAGHNKEATLELKGIFGGDAPFDTPKPKRLMKKLLELVSDNKCVVMDFFSGSGSFAHAVLEKNVEDGGSRRFIAVQLDEYVEKNSGAYKAGYRTIADIAMDRLRKVGGEIEGSVKHPSSVDVGFRVFKVDTSNMSEVYYNPDAIIQDDLFAQVENIKADRTEEDLLFQVMLDWGVDLMAPILRQTIDGKTVFFVDADAEHKHGALVACFDKTGGIDDAFIRQLATFSPLRLVFRDTGFASDAVKINAEQLLKQLSPLTEVKAI